jgi:hypothetical protein
MHRVGVVGGKPTPSTVEVTGGADNAFMIDGEVRVVLMRRTMICPSCAV